MFGAKGVFDFVVSLFADFLWAKTRKTLDRRTAA